MRVNDKVWDGDRNVVDYIDFVWAMDRNGVHERPRNVVMTEKATHSISLKGDMHSDHGPCCNSFMKGRRFFKVHKYDWMNIQSYSENKILTVDHLIVLLSDFTTIDHLLFACNMALKKLSIIGTASQIKKTLKRSHKGRSPVFILDKIMERNNMDDNILDEESTPWK